MTRGAWLASQATSSDTVKRASTGAGARMNGKIRERVEQIGKLEREWVTALHAHDSRDGGGRVVQGATTEEAQRRYRAGYKASPARF